MRPGLGMRHSAVRMSRGTTQAAARSTKLPPVYLLLEPSDVGATLTGPVGFG
jgi:hypothetical protein